VVPWSFDLGGLGSSIGQIGGLAIFGPGAAGGALINQQASQFGPLFFNLDVLKAAAINLTAADANNLTAANTNGGIGPGGQVSLPLTDIGKWSGGVDGAGRSDGTLGWVSNYIVGPNGLNTGIVGVNQQANQIGPGEVDFNIVKGASLSITPGGADDNKPGAHGQGDDGNRPVGPSVSLNVMDIEQGQTKLFGVNGPGGKLGYKTSFDAGPNGFETRVTGINGDQSGSVSFKFDAKDGPSFKITPPGQKPPGGTPDPGDNDNDNP
jgi:hypothetical protein